MKKVAVALAAVLLFFTLSGCEAVVKVFNDFLGSDNILKTCSQYVGVDLPENVDIIEQKDTHGGFHSDGELCMALSIGVLDNERLLNGIDESNFVFGLTKAQRENYRSFIDEMVPLADDSYYCLYNSNDEKLEPLSEGENPRNFVLIEYAPDDAMIYIVLWDS